MALKEEDGVDAAAACLRSRILASLAEQRLPNGHGTSSIESGLGKDDIRRLHHAAVQHAIARAKPGLVRHEVSLLRRIASGLEVNPDTVWPVLVEVQPNSEDELLFRYAKLHWSVPVSAGYGRRIRFLVIDQSNSKLMGIIGLGDPVYSLEARDRWIGWDSDTKRQRIGNILDAFVLGAVPPYNMLLGSKLVAMVACSLDVSEVFRTKYGERTSQIAHQQPKAGLALITTTSALGRSSVYNRLRYGNTLMYRGVGFTKGTGEFHFANELYADILDHVRSHTQPTAKHDAWGNGFRSRREVVLKALVHLGLPQELIYHGVRREVFVAPLADNTSEFLKGESQILHLNDYRLPEIAEFFRQRWLLPRARWDTRYRGFNVDSYCIWKKK